MWQRPSAAVLRPNAKAGANKRGQPAQGRGPPGRVSLRPRDDASTSSWVDLRPNEETLSRAERFTDELLEESRLGDASAVSFRPGEDFAAPSFNVRNLAREAALDAAAGVASRTHGETAYHGPPRAVLGKASMEAAQRSNDLGVQRVRDIHRLEASLQAGLSQRLIMQRTRPAMEAGTHGGLGDPVAAMDEGDDVPENVRQEQRAKEMKELVEKYVNEMPAYVVRHAIVHPIFSSLMLMLSTADRNIRIVAGHRLFMAWIIEINAQFSEVFADSLGTQSSSMNLLRFLDAGAENAAGGRTFAEYFEQWRQFEVQVQDYLGPLVKIDQLVARKSIQKYKRVLL